MEHPQWRFHARGAGLAFDGHAVLNRLPHPARTSARLACSRPSHRSSLVFTQVLHSMFVHIFDGLEKDCPAELAAIRAQYPSERPRCAASPTVLHWEEANAMLAADGVEEPPGLQDLSTAQASLRHTAARWSAHAASVLAGKWRCAGMGHLSLSKGAHARSMPSARALPRTERGASTCCFWPKWPSPCPT